MAILPTELEQKARHEKLRKLFQADLSKPTYLLRGTSDKLLYRATTALTLGLFAVNLYFLAELKKKF